MKNFVIVPDQLLTVIVPTMNEEEGIKRVLSSMPRDEKMEVIVVDSSSDCTAEVARSFGTVVVREDRLGYGRALRSGIEKANGNVVVYIDADGTYDPGEISRLVQPILDGRLDVVLGNRLHKNMDQASMKALNRVGNIVLSFVFRFLFGLNISDSQCGLRAIRRVLLDDVECYEQGMPFVTEQMIRLVKKGARVGQIPISYRRRIGHTKLVPLKDGLKILTVMLRNV